MKNRLEDSVGPDAIVLDKGLEIRATAMLAIGQSGAAGREASWDVFIGAVLGWYTATGMMLEAVFHRPVLSLGFPGTAAQPSPRGTASGEAVTVLGQTPAARRS